MLYVVSVIFYVDLFHRKNKGYEKNVKQNREESANTVTSFEYK